MENGNAVILVQEPTGIWKSPEERDKPNADEIGSGTPFCPVFQSLSANSVSACSFSYTVLPSSCIIDPIIHQLSDGTMATEKVQDLIQKNVYAFPPVER